MKGMVGYLWTALFLTLFWQTRLALCCQGQVVDYLIPFVYLSDVLILALIALALWENRTALRLPLKNLKFLKYLMPVGLFLALAAIANFGAAHPLGAWYKWLKLAEIFGLAFVAANGKSVSSRSALWGQVSLGLVVVALVVWGEVLLQRSLGLQLLGEWQFSAANPGIAKVVLAGRELMRPYATFPHPNVLGGVFSVVAIVNLWEFLRRSNSRDTLYVKRYALGFFLLFSSVVLISFSRTAWLAYGLMLVVTLWIRRASLPFKNLRSLKYLITAVVVVLLPLILIRFSTLATTDALSWERRIQLNRAAVAMIRDHPLTGVGLNNFVPNLEKYSVITGASRFLQPVHNVPLLIAAEVGLPALVLLVTGYWLLARALWRKRAWLLLTIWLGITVTAMFDHYWWTLQHGLLLLALTLGLSLGSILNDEG